MLFLNEPSNEFGHNLQYYALMVYVNILWCRQITHYDTMTVSVLQQNYS